MYHLSPNMFDEPKEDSARGDLILRRTASHRSTSLDWTSGIYHIDVTASSRVEEWQCPILWHTSQERLWVLKPEFEPDPDIRR